MNQDLFSLKDKVVVVTGGAGLLGRNHADAVASFGGNPVLLDIKGEAVREISSEIAKKYGVEAWGIEIDITDELAVERVRDEVVARYKRIDGLVNNAANNPKVENKGGELFSRLEHFDLAQWNKDLEVGLTGAYLCSKYFGFSMAEGAGGSIVNISSDLGLVAPDQRLYQQAGVDLDLQPVKPITYSVVKTGLIGMTRYLATYWAEKSVRCNALCPGGVESGQDPEFLREVQLRIPLHRLARPDEYQGSLVWLLSGASSYLTGAIIPVDGGRTTW